MIATVVDSLHGLTFTDVIVLAGVLAYVVDRVADTRGWSKSSKVLRLENTDLARRNEELERDLARHDKTIANLGSQITRLEDQVRTLEKLDQSAVLLALHEHEIGAMGRAEKTNGLLDRIAHALETRPQGAS